MFRPDFSNYLAHFTKDISDENTALDILIKILKERKLCASKMPWTNVRAVCFTECPWGSLLAHAQRYSSYGLGFEKNFIFSRNGAPVYYVRADQYEKQKWHKHLKPFVTPFWPYYAPKEKKDFRLCDYSHEREWRVPHDLEFEYEKISFVILNAYEDMAKFPKNLKDSIGREKFILMENYRNVERLWPVHKIE